MRIEVKFHIKGRGPVATGRLTTNGPKPGDTARRADGASWLIRGVEWYALPRTDDPNGNGTTRPGPGDSIGVLLSEDPEFHIGDDLTFEYRKPAP